MNKRVVPVLSFLLFLNLYVALTYFWKISEVFYANIRGGVSVLIAAQFAAALSIVVRHAQLIEIKYEKLKQNEYSLGCLGLLLPIIAAVLRQDIDTEILCYLLVFLAVFELCFLGERRWRVFLGYKTAIFCAAAAVYMSFVAGYVIRLGERYNVSLEFLYVVLALVIILEIARTCAMMPKRFSDRYSMYILAYFSVAGVLLNYCSEHIANGKLQQLLNSPLGVDVIPIIFWVVVVMRIVQSIHLAALDYQNTDVKGVDLALLALFYVFITAYRLLNENDPVVYVVLFVLSGAASAYFAYMAFSRIYKESTIAYDFDKRIQVVNSVTFACICVASVYMYMGGYSAWTFILLIGIVMFNMAHSSRLTMWVKFDLLYGRAQDGLVFKPVHSREVKILASAISYHFGYIYKFYLGEDAPRRDIRRFIHLLLTSGSSYGWLGRAHYYSLLSGKDGKRVGYVCLKTDSNNSLFYSLLSFGVLLVRCMGVFGVRKTARMLGAMVAESEYLSQLDLSDCGVLEVTYIIIRKPFRRQGCARAALALLLDAPARLKKLYPGKRVGLDVVRALVREKNLPALALVSGMGFDSISKLQHPQVDNATAMGGAFVVSRKFTGGADAIRSLA